MVIKRGKKIVSDILLKLEEKKPPDKIIKRKIPKEFLNPNDLTKYWLSQARTLSNELWLPTNTGYVGSGNNISTNCSNITEIISSNEINRNINNVTNLQKSYHIHDTNEVGGNKLIKKLKEKNLKDLRKKEKLLHDKLIKSNPNRLTKKITENDITDYSITSKRIKVSPVDIKSRRTINDGIAVSRKIWNCCVTESQKNNPKITYTQLRAKFVEAKNMSKTQLKELSWTFRIQQKVREAVTRRFSVNYETAKKNFEKYKRKYFYKIKKKKNKKTKNKIKKKITMQFRDKSNEKQTIFLSNEICKFRIIKKSGKTILETFNGVKLVLEEKYDNFDTSTKCDRCQHIFNNKTGLENHLKNKKPCKQSSLKIESGRPQAELILQRIGYEYYLYIPEYKTPVITKEASSDIVAIDVGWNTLLTYFSPSGEWGEICPGIKDKINGLRKKIKKIKSFEFLGKKNKRKAIQKRLMYIVNIVDDLHWKICHWLLSKFRRIIISRLYVAKSSKQGKQTQADLKLCAFVDRLIHKSIEYKNSEIHVCKEHNTSKACTNCLSLKTVKGKTVRCKDCKHEIHRDLNGARNIFLKHCY